MTKKNPETAAISHVYIAYANDTGSNEEERTLGVFLKEGDAHAEVLTFVPPEWEDGDEDIDIKWVLRKSFDQTHDSGAVHVTRYTLEGSDFWEAHVIKYEVR